jgi:hypothetical protein
VRHLVDPLPGRGSSVKEDWRARLPEEKTKVFHAYGRELEFSYSMLSVSLNEALELHHAGQLTKSWQAIGVTTELCSRLTGPLAALIRVLGAHAKHYGTVPNTAALDAANFQSPKGQRSARISALLSRILLSQRTQFLHKLGTLEEMVEDLGKEYVTGAGELGEGLGTDPIALWQIVDTSHYDLNTCLRETIVLLKSFLRALPDEQLSAFQRSVAESWRGTAMEIRPATQHPFRHRRMAHTAGK